MKKMTKRAMMKAKNEEDYGTVSWGEAAKMSQNSLG